MFEPITPAIARQDVTKVDLAVAAINRLLRGGNRLLSKDIIEKTTGWMLYHEECAEAALKFASAGWKVKISQDFYNISE